MIELQLIKPLTDQEIRAQENRILARQAVAEYRGKQQNFDTQPLVLTPEQAEFVARETAGNYADYEELRVALTGNLLEVKDGVTYCGKPSLSTRAMMQKLGIK